MFSTVHPVGDPYPLAVAPFLGNPSAVLPLGVEKEELGEPCHWETAAPLDLEDWGHFLIELQHVIGDMSGQIT